METKHGKENNGNFICQWLVKTVLIDTIMNTYKCEILIHAITSQEERRLLTYLQFSTFLLL